MIQIEKIVIYLTKIFLMPTTTKIHSLKFSKQSKIIRKPKTASLLNRVVNIVASLKADRDVRPDFIDFCKI